MKGMLFSIGLISLILGCSTAEKETKSTTIAEQEISIDYDSLAAIWIYDFNQETEEFEIKQLRTVDSNTLSGEMLEKIINKMYPRVQINFIRTSNDTAFISIPDSQVLTQQMGSAGAESFMISTTYSFTELNGIKYVSFDFTEGDHARPGVYSRNSWDENIVQ